MSHSVSVRARNRIARLFAPRRLERLRARSPRAASAIERVQAENLTGLELPALLDLAEAMLAAEDEQRPGSVIEAGTAYGGAAIVLAAAKSPERPLVLYDVFGPFPAPGAKDPEEAHTRHAVIAGGAAEWPGGRPFYSYVDDLIGNVKRSFEDCGLDADENNVTFVKGLIEETLRIDGPVALAHVDCDWYAPVLACLERIAPRLEPGGAIVLDDYDDWSGARDAVSAHLASHPGLVRRRHSRVHLVRPR